MGNPTNTLQSTLRPELNPNPFRMGSSKYPETLGTPLGVGNRELRLFTFFSIGDLSVTRWGHNSPCARFRGQRSRLTYLRVVRKCSILGTRRRIRSVTRHPFKLRTLCSSTFCKMLSCRMSNSSGMTHKGRPLSSDSPSSPTHSPAHPTAPEPPPAAPPLPGSPGEPAPSQTPPVALCSHSPPQSGRPSRSARSLPNTDPRPSPRSHIITTPALLHSNPNPGLSTPPDFQTRFQGGEDNTRGREKKITKYQKKTNKQTNIKTRKQHTQEEGEEKNPKKKKKKKKKKTNPPYTPKSRPLPPSLASSEYASRSPCLATNQPTNPARTDVDGRGIRLTTDSQRYSQIQTRRRRSRRRLSTATDAGHSASLSLSLPQAASLHTHTPLHCSDSSTSRFTSVRPSLRSSVCVSVRLSFSSSFYSFKRSFVRQ
uniref:Uncharacterized protein n=1 Tax=Physcomitrium patens TaxID=3218 RepID=A0A2K1IRD4_PHYPA|nr:hypothetical protein PHYPA_025958 [Physcomitrium patens]